MHNKINNILVFRNDRFGEFILNIPAFKALKSAYPGSKITLVVDYYVAELAATIDCVDDVIIWNNKKHSLIDILRFAASLRRRKFALSVVFNPVKESHWICFLAGIPIRLGYNRKCGFLLTHKVERLNSDGQRHEVIFNLDLLKAISINSTDTLVALSPTDYDKEFVDRLLSESGIAPGDNFIVLHPWTSDPVKEWPTEKFQSLAYYLTNNAGLKVVVIGGQQEKARGDAFCKENSKLINFVGKISLRQLAALLHRSALLVSNDSGPVHLSGAVGRPVLALFRDDISAKGPKRWGPWGENGSVISKNSLQQIEVDEVVVRIKQILRLN